MPVSASTEACRFALSGPHINANPPKCRSVRIARHACEAQAPCGNRPSRRPEHGNLLHARTFRDHVGMKPEANDIQYTVRGIPRALRRKAARRKLSLN